MRLTAWRDQVCAKEYVARGGRRHGRAPPAGETSGPTPRQLSAEIDAQRFRDTSAVFGIGSIEVNELAFDDLDRHAVHRFLNVVKQLLLLIGRHQPEQVSGLTIVVVAVAMIIAGRVTHDLERRLAVALVLHRAVERVWLIEGVRIRFALEPHRAVSVIIVHLCARPVDRELVRVDAYPVAMGVRVGEDAGLQHLIG
jgi:hypothetical protein